MTSLGGGVLQKVTKCDKGGGGRRVKNRPIRVDIISERSLIEVSVDISI